MGSPTTNYGWTKPTVGSDTDAWGAELNADLDGIDSTVFAVSGVANTANTTANAALPKAGGAMTGPISSTAAGLPSGSTHTVAFGAFMQGSQDASGWSPASYSSIPVSLDGAQNGYMVRTVFTAGSVWPIHVIQTNNSMTSVAGQLQSANNINWSVTSCDGRVKHDLAPASDALAAINSVPVYSATYARPGLTFRERWDYTLIAQQVREALPFAYLEPLEGGYASLHPLHLIATLWRAVQQLTERLEELEPKRG